MFRCIVFSTAAALLSGTIVFAQGSQSGQQTVTTELVVKVTYENDRPVGDQVRVQLTSSSGVPLMDSYTSGESEVHFFGVQPGGYRLRITGLDIEDKFSDYSFSIQPREVTHMEFIRVRRKPEKDAQTSTQSSVSAAALNVPAKAGSEFDKGVKALNKKDPEEARRRFARAVELYPRYAAAFNNLGVISMQQGNTDEGLGFFRQAVLADEQYAPPYLNLAKAVFRKKDYVEAEQLLLKATSIDPTNVEMLAILAMIEFDSNKMPLALINARKAIGQPNHERFAYAHYIVGRVLESQHQTAEALAEYRLFLKEAPNDSSALDVRGFIAALEQKR